jgi:hypothetical protein
MKGFHLGRILVTAAIVLAIVAVASRIPPVRKFVFNA